MSIPLDRLYHYIESVAQEIYKGNIVIYRFYPHGSKNIENLSMLNAVTSEIETFNPELICHDQEPLNYDFYKNCLGAKLDPSAILALGKDIAYYRANLRRRVNNIFDKCLLLHSEKNSSEVKKYSQDQFIPIYYWSHALIARDWYRYSQHINPSNFVHRKFLIYNRAWSGTREYRLKFADQLIDFGLVDCCLTTVGLNDNQTYYKDHQFKNTLWKPQHHLENYFSENTTTSYYSADFDINDYNSTDIEVILETLFDDSRLHLTEKTLRPIALGQPFILTGPAGSLQYLRDYGFKTFHSVFDESYDQISNPAKRLLAITKLMSDIKNLSQTEYVKLLIELRKISLYNKEHFFSNNFFKIITQELKTNLANGISTMLATNTCDRFITFRTALNNNIQFDKWRSINYSPELLDETVKFYQKAMFIKESCSNK